MITKETGMTKAKMPKTMSPTDRELAECYRLLMQHEMEQAKKLALQIEYRDAQIACRDAQIASLKRKVESMTKQFEKERLDFQDWLARS